MPNFIEIGWYPVTLQEQKAADPVKGIFYQQELVKAKLPLTFAVDVIGERRRGKKREVLVHYRGYNSRHDRWLPAGDVVTSGGEG